MASRSRVRASGAIALTRVRAPPPRSASAPRSPPWPRPSRLGAPGLGGVVGARGHADHGRIGLISGLRLRLPVLGGMTQHCEVSLQVHRDHRVTATPPCRRCRRHEQNAVNQRIENHATRRWPAARCLSHFQWATLSVLATALPPAATISSFAGPGRRRHLRRGVPAEVVDGEQQRVLTPDAAARAVATLPLSAPIPQLPSVISARPSVITKSSPRSSNA